jgi:molybdate transport system substrate-binding protein
MPQIPFLNKLVFTTLVGICVSGSLAAQEIRIAVASNFHRTMVDLIERYEARDGHRAVVIPGSSGKHYAQILNGAPFDVFFSADARRPELLEEQGRAVPGSRYTYALGRLVLWSVRSDLVDSGGTVLGHGSFRHLAIANERLAPYGAAAKDLLMARGLWERLASRIVRGENVAQAFQFVASGNAELGLIHRTCTA